MHDDVSGDARRSASSLSVQPSGALCFIGVRIRRTIFYACSIITQATNISCVTSCPFWHLDMVAELVTLMSSQFSQQVLSADIE